VRDRRSNYVDAAVWALVAAGALPWCRWCRAACPGHPVTADVVEQLLAMPEPVEDVTAACVVTVSH
jgi:hypothetical protein